MGLTPPLCGNSHTFFLPFYFYYGRPNCEPLKKSVWAVVFNPTSVSIINIHDWNHRYKIFQLLALRLVAMDDSYLQIDLRMLYTIPLPLHCRPLGTATAALSMGSCSPATSWTTCWWAASAAQCLPGAAGRASSLCSPGVARHSLMSFPIRN